MADVNLALVPQIMRFLANSLLNFGPALKHKHDQLLAIISKTQAQANSVSQREVLVQELYHLL